MISFLFSLPRFFVVVVRVAEPLWSMLGALPVVFSSLGVSDPQKRKIVCDAVCVFFSLVCVNGPAWKELRLRISCGHFSGNDASPSVLSLSRDASAPRAPSGGGGVQKNRLRRTPRERR